MNDTPQIQAILFDADGVLQRPSVWWREALMPILGAVDIAEVDPFLRDILETELAHLCTPSGFDAALMETLVRWNRSERFSDTAQALNAIRPYDDVIAVVSALRQVGMPCHIASNQQAGRARHMSEGLGYKTLFVEEFYSCRLGFAKPDFAYFNRVLELLDLPGQICEPPTDIFEDMSLTMEGKAHSHTVTWCGDQPIVDARKVLNDLADRYFP